jgi:hypothetical protein
VWQVRPTLALLFLAACLDSPDVSGRACSSLSPCPEGFVCTLDATCQRTCEVQRDCPEGSSCVASVCRPDALPDGGANPPITDAGGPLDRGATADSGADDRGTPGLDADLFADATASPDAEPSADAAPPCNCTTPPPSECVQQDSVFRSYSMIGTCDQSGACQYASNDLSCPGCQATCLDPCGNVRCDQNNGGCRSAGFCMPGPLGQPASCSYTLTPDGTACTRPGGGAGFCVVGDCVECVRDQDCADANACTADRCDLGTGTCTHPSTFAGCDDGNACTFGDACNTSAACRGTSYSCDDQNRCTGDACNGMGGCNRTLVAPDSLSPSGGVSISTMDVVMTWNACADAQHYDVEVQVEIGGSFVFYFTYDENNPTAPTSATKTIYPCGGACNSRMRYRVRSYNGATHGPWSAWATYLWANCRAC